MDHSCQLLLILDGLSETLPARSIQKIIVTRVDGTRDRVVLANNAEWLISDRTIFPLNLYIPGTSNIGWVIGAQWALVPNNTFELSILIG